VAIGLSIFVLLLVYELWRRPKESTRSKEYAFLFGVTLLAMAYGILHDFVTWSICRDYYVIGKGIPSAASGYSMDVVKLAMKATWTAGLLCAAAFLVANNPDRLRRQLPYSTLLQLMFIPLAASILLEFLLGIAFGRSAVSVASRFGMMTYLELSGPRFFAVWGMHIGAYSGAALGLLAAIATIVVLKRRLPLPEDRPS
jgi:hypothetical protein